MCKYTLCPKLNWYMIERTCPRALIRIIIQIRKCYTTSLSHWQKMHNEVKFVFKCDANKRTLLQISVCCYFCQAFHEILKGCINNIIFSVFLAYRSLGTACGQLGGNLGTKNSMLRPDSLKMIIIIMIKTRKNAGEWKCFFRKYFPPLFVILETFCVKKFEESFKLMSETWGLL